MKLKVLALTAACALAATPAASGVYWRGEVTPSSVALIDFSTLEHQPNGDRTFILRTLSPRGTMMHGRPISVTSYYTAVSCDEGVVRIMGGTVFGEDAQIVSRFGSDPTPKKPQPGSSGWRHLRLVCADTDQERAQFGTFVGEASLGEAVQRFRPGAPTTD